MSSATLLVRWLIPFLFCIAAVRANVEKIILVAPEAQAMPADASIDNLMLPTISDSGSGIRTFLNASFPTEEAAKGTQTWMLLEDLKPGQRYEVRINWIATQPTLFWLYEHTMQSVFSAPELLSSLTTYSIAHRAAITPTQLESIQLRSQLRKSKDAGLTTFLFLQIFAKADYFTLNKTMMDNVPPVQVDVILDPYLLNIFPTSLIPTAGYLVVIAVSGWFLSGWIITSLIRPLASDTHASERRRQR